MEDLYTMQQSSSYERGLSAIHQVMKYRLPLLTYPTIHQVMEHRLPLRRDKYNFTRWWYTGCHWVSVRQFARWNCTGCHCERRTWQHISWRGFYQPEQRKTYIVWNPGIEQGWEVPLRDQQLDGRCLDTQTMHEQGHANRLQSFGQRLLLHYFQYP